MYKIEIIPQEDRKDAFPEAFAFGKSLMAGTRLAMRFERTLYAVADRFCRDYNGGSWEMVKVTDTESGKTGFFMYPQMANKALTVMSPGMMCDVDMTPYTFGIGASLMVYSHLSMVLFQEIGPKETPLALGEAFHAVRDYVIYSLDEEQCSAIMAFID